MPTKRKIALEDLFRFRVCTHVAMSPDGTKIAVAVKRCDPKKNRNFSSLYMAKTKGGRLRRLTHGNHVDTEPTWSPDGNTLAFVSNRDKADCIYLMPMDGGEPKRLTERDRDVSGLCFSPDGKNIAYAARMKSEREILQRDDKTEQLEQMADYVHTSRLIYKLDGAGVWNGNYTHLYTIGARGGTSKQLTHSDHDDAMSAWSPDGKRIGFLSNRRPDPDRECENMDIFTIPAHGGRPKQVTTRHGPLLAFSWSPDGKTFAFIGHFGKHGEWSQHNVHVWTIPTSGGTTKNITPSIDNNCFNITVGDTAPVSFEGYPPRWSADGKRVYFVVSERGACNLYEASTTGKDAKPVWADDHVICGLSQPASTGHMAISHSSGTNPSDVYVLNIEDTNAVPKRVTHVNRAVLNGLDIAKPQAFACNRGKHTVHGWVFRPPGASPTKKTPLVLQIHGGPYAQYGWTFFHEMQFLAAKGYTVLATNPRGSIGYGLDFVKALRHKWGVPDTPDVLACVDKLVRQGGIDKKRMYITGGSYGGFMTNWITARDDRFRAAATQRCVYNMESMMASDFGWQLGEEMGVMPWNAPAEFRKKSPSAYVKTIRTPLLIIHSDQDLRCPINQAEELFATLKYLGREVEMICFKGESHGLSRGGKPQNRAERLRRILDWFERHK